MEAPMHGFGVFSVADVVRGGIIVIIIVIIIIAIITKALAAVPVPSLALESVFGSAILHVIKDHCQLCDTCL
jgi:hypothetical protein